MREGFQICGTTSEGPSGPLSFFLEVYVVKSLGSRSEDLI